MTDTPLRILELRIGRLKKLTAVAIRPDRSVIELRGPNNSGKSTILQAIQWGLTGSPPRSAEVVQDGADVARIRLTIGREDAELVIERRIRKDGDTVLSVTNAAGFKAPRPQEMLQALIGAGIAFDPVRWIREDAKVQAETLRRLAGVDTRAVDAGIAQALEDRRVWNKAAQQQETQAQAARAKAPAEKPELVDTSELLNARTAAEQQRSERSRRLQAVERVAEAVLLANAEVERLERELQDAKGRLQVQQDRLAEAKAAVPEPVAFDFEANATAIAGADDARRQLAAWDDAEKQEREAKIARDKWGELDKLVDELRASRVKMLAEAKLPLPGLAIDEEGGIRFEGHPLESVNTAGKLQVACAVALASAPKLRVLLVEDGGVLDSANLAWLEGWAAEHKAQLWIEVPDDEPEEGDDALWIFGGAVRGQDGLQVDGEGRVTTAEEAAAAEEAARPAGKKKAKPEQGGLL